MARKAKIKVIVIIGRRWFDRANGNTYHTSSVYVDGAAVPCPGIAYGYGTAYQTTAETCLEAAGYMPGRLSYPSGGGEGIWYYCDRLGISLISEVSNVGRKADLLGR